MSSTLDFIHSVDKCERCYHYSQHVQYSFPFLWSAGSKDASLRHQELDGSCCEWDDEDYGNALGYMERYKRAMRERDEERLLASLYRQELDLLRQQLEETKDRLLAIQLAYEEWSNLAPSQFDFHPPPTVPDLTPTAQDIINHPDYFVDDGEWLYPSAVDHPNPHSLPSSDLRDDEAVAMTMDPQVDDDFEIRQQLEFMHECDQDFVQPESRPSFLDYRPASDESSRSAVCKLTECGTGGIDMVSPNTSPISSSPASSLSESTTDSGTSPPEVPTTVGVTDWVDFPEINRLSALMKAAHDSNDEDALAKVKILVTEAHNTARNKRTQAHAFLLQKWRNPTQRIHKPSAATPNQPPVALPPSRSPPPPVSIAEGKIYANDESRLNIVAEGSDISYPEIFVDASSLGIGFVHQGQWLAWNFRTGAPLPGDMKHKNGGNKSYLDINWSELLAAELGIRTLIAAGVKSVPITVRSDNEGVVKFLRDKVCPEKQGMEVIFRRILALCEENALELRARWVWTKINPADGPSRRIYPPASLQFRSWPILPKELDELVCLA